MSPLYYLVLSVFRLLLPVVRLQLSAYCFAPPVLPLLAASGFGAL